MIKLEKTGVFGWESAIRELYNGKGVRWVYPNSYEAYISTHGKFLSCGTYPSEIVESVEKGYFASPRGNIYNRHGDLMIGGIDHCGYRHTILNRKNRNVHRVIAETFIPNPNNLPCVNHKDGNKLNNSVDNLEWCTHSENTLHSYQTGLQTTNRWGKVTKYVNQN